MITIESTLNATYGKSSINDIFGLNPRPQQQMKPPKTLVEPIIPDNDAEIASINTHPLREEFAGIQNNLRRNSIITSEIQNYRQLAAALIERRDQTSDQVKELSQRLRMTKDKTARQQTVRENIRAINKQINDIVENAHFDSNKLVTAAGQDSENPDYMLEKVKKESFTTLMEFELRDVPTLKEYLAENNMTMAVAKYTMSRVMQDMRQALQSQAHVSSTAAAVLINGN